MKIQYREKKKNKLFYEKNDTTRRKAVMSMQF